MSVNVAGIELGQRIEMQPFWPTLTILFLGSFVGMYHIASLNISLPAFISIFGTDLHTAQWLVSGFTLASGVIAPVSGYAGDRFGNKNLFLLALAGITISSFLSGLAWNIYALIVFRVIQGVFCGLIQVVSLAMIYQMIPREKQPFAVSIWSFATVLGTAVSPTISGWLLGYHWQWMFLVTVPLGLIVWLVGWRVLPVVSSSSHLKLDSLGLALAVTGSLSLLLLFGNFHQWGISSPTTWFTLLLSLTSGLWFVLHVLKSKQPLLELRLFKSRAFTMSLCISLIFSVGLYTGIYFVPLYLQEVKGLTPYEVGLVFIPAAVLLTAGTFVAGRFYNKPGPVALITAGSMFMVCTMFQFSYLKADTSLLFIIILLALRNFGTGLSMSPLTNIGMMNIPRELSSHASALINWLRQVFSAIVIGLFTSIYYRRYDVHLAQLMEGADRREASFHSAAYILGINDVFLIASITVCLVIPMVWLLRGQSKYGE
ncbi:DHA2 family efflux MFS transporter permease subunit [Paenibacillus eucommiae]|uniref:EmrB/QacA subfamily drug resistance transporter n=1 Tax=Paenibacillus eucommiae TaxID=1355755 RepID=A0ABS4J6Q6_9BACL|nr:DHA2 family efflux MFS transporter permease subunit [Paenibacillus eucommiae]MBP1994469.1 EmrB/QacA subfamily drug resistance transporter [Paenibacillus eucommiae]